MESTSLCSSSSPPLSNPFLSSSTCLKNHHQKRAVSVKTFSMRRSEAHDQNCSNGRIVDESMIVLRKRIHEMKMIERNYEPPADWMAWEKRYYTSYDSIICDVMCTVQSQLMNTRPSLALGVLLLIMFSVPTSAVVMFSHFMEMAKGVVEAGIHVI